MSVRVNVQVPVVYWHVLILASNSTIVCDKQEVHIDTKTFVQLIDLGKCMPRDKISMMKYFRRKADKRREG